MRNIKITEVDSNCYVIETNDFQDGDAIVYNWDKTSQSFYGEYQRATNEKRQFQRESFVFADYPTVGQAIDFIWKRERELCDQRWNAMVASKADSYSVTSIP